MEKLNPFEEMYLNLSLAEKVETLINISNCSISANTFSREITKLLPEILKELKRKESI
jgi:hypothetical protein